MINIIWAGMFLVATLVATFKLLFLGDLKIFNELIDAIFTSASSAVDISIGLVGILCFWLGILRLIEETGLAKKIADKLSPFFRVVMKDIPENSPAISTIVLNMSANFLGLDNAATPMGIKAMEKLQIHNKNKKEASDAQILFMILNSSSVTLIPITIFMYRAKMGATYPTDVFIPILLATSVSTLVGFLLVAIKQKIDFKNKLLQKFLFYFIFIIVTISVIFLAIPSDKRLIFSSAIGNILLMSLLSYVIFLALKKHLKSYELFIDGAKDGFNLAIRILPYLLSMLVAIAVFRTCGVLDLLVDMIKSVCSFLYIDDKFVDALPTAIMKPLSGSGARAMMIETMQNFGPNSFASFTSSVIQGSTETTFYVLTVYFGAVRISKIRYALKYALLSDLAGIIAAIVFSYIFFDL